MTFDVVIDTGINSLIALGKGKGNNNKQREGLEENMARILAKRSEKRLRFLFKGSESSSIL